MAVAKDMLKHFSEKGYKSTFQVYLNDKYFYKQYDEKKKARGKGTSFWLLDEPANIDDYLALAFFGKLFRQAQDQAGPDAAKTGAHRFHLGNDLVLAAAENRGLDFDGMFTGILFDLEEAVGGCLGVASESFAEAAIQIQMQIGRASCRERV